MTNNSLFGLLAAGTLFLSACAAPPPTAAPEPTVTSAPVVVEPSQAPTSAAEAAPTTEPAAASTKVEITLADNTVNSTLSTFQTGVPYTFVIMNKGRHEHNFNVAPPVAVAGGYAEALAQALLAVDETQIPPGSTFTVDFTFPDSAAGADLEFSCLIRRHYEDGMWMKITVTS